MFKAASTYTSTLDVHWMLKIAVFDEKGQTLQSVVIFRLAVFACAVDQIGGLYILGIVGLAEHDLVLLFVKVSFHFDKAT